MATILHRSNDRRPIAEIEPGDWVWDDRNDEPAQFHGWSTLNRCYIATWLSGAGDYCMWDLDGTSQPVVLEVLVAERLGTDRTV